MSAKLAPEHVTTAHANDLQWKKDFIFYKEELTWLRKRLEEVSSKNTAEEIKLKVSHFENQFIIHSRLLTNFNEEIKLRESAFTADLKNNPVAFEHKTTTLLNELKDEVNKFEKLYTELKKDFYKFLSETM